MKIGDLLVGLKVDDAPFLRDVNTTMNKAASKASVGVKMTVDDAALRTEMSRAVSSGGAGANAEAKKVGTKLEDSLGGAIARGLKEGFDEGMRDVKSSAAPAGERTGDGLLGGIKGKVSLLGKAGGPIGLALAALAPLALAAGGTLGGLLMKGLERETSKNKFAAATGLDPVTVGKLASAAGNAYANNFGDSISANLDTARTALGAGLINKQTTAKDAQAVIESLSGITDLFEVDIPTAVTAAGHLMKTGLAKDATEAGDLIAKGLQLQGGQADDILETFNEYGTQFRKLGIDGPTALGLISQGLKAGARDTDIVADAFKEFSIRAIDGSKLTKDAYKSLGVDADDFAQRVAKGGKSAADATQDILTKLKAIEDPVERNRVGVELFGTQWEDLGDAVNSLDLKKARKEMDDTAGTAKRMTDLAGSGAAASIESAKRTIETAAGDIGAALAQAFSPLINDLGAWISTHRAEITSFFLQAADAGLVFGEALAQGASVALHAYAELEHGVGAVVDSVLAGVEHMLGALAAIPIIGENFKPALNAVKDFREEAKQAYADAAGGAQGLADKLDNTLIPGIEATRSKLAETGKTAIASAAFADSSKIMLTTLAEIGVRADGSEVKIKKWSDRLKLSAPTQALLAGQIASASGALRDQISAAQDANVSQQELTQVWKDGKKGLYEEFVQMGLSKKEAHKLANAYADVPPKIETKVTQPGMDDAIGSAQTLYDTLNNLDGLEVSPAVLLGISNKISQPGFPGGRNSGGGGFALGGYISGPGGPREDLIPAMLSNGEFVMQSAAVNKYGAGFMSMINAGKFAFGGLAKYASGGRVILHGRTSGERGVYDGLTSAIVKLSNSMPGGTGRSVGQGLFRPTTYGQPGAIHDQSTGFPATDVGVPVGTAVYAGAAGRVVKSMDIKGFEPRNAVQNGFKSYGKMIQVASNGFSTLYAHLSNRGVGVGSVVAGGQVIGTSGNTGHSTGPHLHFGAAGRSPLSFFASGGLVKGLPKKYRDNFKRLGYKISGAVATPTKDILEGGLDANSFGAPIARLLAAAGYVNLEGTVYAKPSPGLAAARRQASADLKEEISANKATAVAASKLRGKTIDQQISSLQKDRAGTARMSDEWVAFTEQIKDLRKTKREALAEFKATIQGSEFGGGGVASQVTAGADFGSIIQGVVDQAKGMLEAGVITKKAFNQLHGVAASYFKQLTDAQTALDGVNKAIEENEIAFETANQALEDAKTKYEEYTTAVLESINALGAFSSMNDGVSDTTAALEAQAAAQDVVNASVLKYGENSVNTAKARELLANADKKVSDAALTGTKIVTNVQDAIAKVKSFIANLRIIKGFSLGEGALKQIISMGPIAGAPFAEALAKGGQGVIDSLNTANSELAAIGTDFGIETATWFGMDTAVSNAEIAANKISNALGTGILDGLRRDRIEIEAEITSLGGAMAAAFKKALGIASPSKVFQELGVNTLLGLQQGLKSQVPNTIGQIDSLAGSIGSSATVVTAPTSSGGAGPVVHIDRVEVRETVDLGTLTQRLTFWARSNGRTR